MIRKQILLLTALFLMLGGLLMNHNTNALSPPQNCTNRYTSTITSFVIDYPGGRLDALANPNSTFTVPSFRTPYNVTLTVHTANQSVNGNTASGETWYATNAYGYSSAGCILNAGPNADLTVLNTVQTNYFAPSQPSPIKDTWSTENSTVTYYVAVPQAVNSSTTTSSSSTTSSTTTTASSTTTTSSSSTTTTATTPVSSTSVTSVTTPQTSTTTTTQAASTTTTATTSHSTTTSTTHSTPDFAGYYLPLALVASLTMGAALIRRKRKTV